MASFFNQTFSVTTNALVGSSREAPSLFPKYSQSAAKAKEVEPAGCFCKSFKYPGTDPINSTETEKQPGLSLPSDSVCLSVSVSLFLSLSVTVSLSHYKLPEISNKAVYGPWLPETGFPFANLMPKGWK